MPSLKHIRNTIATIFFSIFASLAELTAIISTNTASSWGNYQPTLPKDLSR